MRIFSGIQPTGRKHLGNYIGAIVQWVAAQDRGRVVEPLAQLAGVVGDGDGVQVDDAEDALAALLACHVLDDRADVVAEVLAPGGLNAREDAHG